MKTTTTTKTGRYKKCACALRDVGMFKNEESWTTINQHTFMESYLIKTYRIWNVNFRQQLGIAYYIVIIDCHR